MEPSCQRHVRLRQKPLSHQVFLGPVAVCLNIDLQGKVPLIRERLRSCAQEIRYVLSFLRGPPRHFAAGQANEAPAMPASFRFRYTSSGSESSSRTTTSINSVTFSSLNPLTSKPWAMAFRYFIMSVR